LVVVLDVDDQARDKGTQNLGNDVSDGLQGREALEEGSQNGYRRTEVSPRDGSTDGNGEDNSYTIGKTDPEYGCRNRISERRSPDEMKGDRHPTPFNLARVPRLKAIVAPVPAKV
jgi:hypothetical protein